MGRNEVCVGNVEIGRRNPTRCNSIQLFINPKLLHMFRASIAPIIRSTQNCSCSLWHRSYHLRSKQVLPRQYDLYQRLQLQFYVLLMMGVMDARIM